MMNGDFGGGWWLLMMIPMMLFWLLVIGGAVWLVVSLGRGRGGAEAAAEEILKRRLAAGEIDVAEYRALRDELRGGRSGGISGRGSVPSVLAAALLASGVVYLAVVGVAAAARADWSWGGWGDWGMSRHHQAMHGGTDTSDSPAVIGSASEGVTMRDYAFRPGNLQVPVGATVTWTNEDPVPHDATAESGAWKTVMVNPGESASITFDEAGEFPYFCSIHPTMKARIVVG